MKDWLNSGLGLIILSAANSPMNNNNNNNTINRITFEELIQILTNKSVETTIILQCLEYILKNLITCRTYLETFTKHNSIQLWQQLIPTLFVYLNHNKFSHIICRTALSIFYIFTRTLAGKQIFEYHSSSLSYFLSLFSHTFPPFKPEKVDLMKYNEDIHFLLINTLQNLTYYPPNITGDLLPIYRVYCYKNIEIMGQSDDLIFNLQKIINDRNQQGFVRYKSIWILSKLVDQEFNQLGNIHKLVNYQSSQGGLLLDLQKLFSDPDRSNYNDRVEGIKWITTKLFFHLVCPQEREICTKIAKIEGMIENLFYCFIEPPIQMNVENISVFAEKILTIFSLFSHLKFQICVHFLSFKMRNINKNNNNNNNNNNRNIHYNKNNNNEKSKFKYLELENYFEKMINNDKKLALKLNSYEKKTYLLKHSSSDPLITQKNNQNILFCSNDNINNINNNNNKDIHNDNIININNVNNNNNQKDNKNNNNIVNYSQQNENEIENFNNNIKEKDTNELL